MAYALVLLAAGTLIIVSMTANHFFRRVGVPSLLITLGIGLLFGNGGDLGFLFNYPIPTLHFSEIALCIIIFAGGFESNWARTRPVLRMGVSMATLGVLLTMLVVGIFCHYGLGWSWLQALLLGAVVSSTDAAAVFSILENSQLKLKNGVQEVLELESGTNDPMGFFLTASLSALMLAPATAKPGFLSLSFDFIVTMSIGLITGLLAGRLMLFFIQKIQLKRGQYAVMLLAWVLVLYAINTLLGGSSLLAVFVAGVVVGNAPWIQREINMNFFEGLSWLMETALFLILGLQVYLFDLPKVAWTGLAVAAVLIFLARPIATFASLAFFKKIGWRTKIFFSWVGLRGATPIVFALIPVVQKVPGATEIFHICFIVVLISMLVQGTTVSKMAALTRLERSDEHKTVRKK